MMNELRLDWVGTTPPVCAVSDYFSMITVMSYVYNVWYVKGVLCDI